MLNNNTNMSNTIKLINKQFIHDYKSNNDTKGTLLFEKKDTRIYNILEQLKIIPTVICKLIFDYILIYYEFNYTISKTYVYEMYVEIINIESTNNNIINVSLTLFVSDKLTRTDLIISKLNIIDDMFIDDNKIPFFNNYMKQYYNKDNYIPTEYQYYNQIVHIKQHKLLKHLIIMIKIIMTIINKHNS